MTLTSVIVEVRTGEGEAVLKGLASLKDVTVYGILENRVVTVIEGDDMNSIHAMIKEISALENVTGVYPVYVGDDKHYE